MKKLLACVAAIFIAFFVILAGRPITANAPPVIWFDALSDNCYINPDGNLAITGWSVNQSGVTKVSIYVNGVSVGSVHTGIQRTDVDNVMNKSGAYKGAEYAGFSAVAAKSLLSGQSSYTIRAVSYGNDGSSTSVTVHALKATAELCIDTPTAGSTQSTDFRIVGWSISNKGVKAVTVSIDNGSPVAAVTGDARQDVNGIFNSVGGYPGAANSGFHLDIPISSFGYTSYGSHTIRVDSIDNSGQSVSQTVAVNIQKRPPCGFIDFAGGSVNGYFYKALTVSGWALNSTGIADVKVQINGQTVADDTNQAHIHLQRPDVQNALNKNGGYRDAQTSGYSISIPNLPAYAPGNYNLTVLATGADGTVCSISKTILQYQPVLYIDRPGAAANVTDSLSVAGWAVAPAGISQVKVSIDGTAAAVSNGIPRMDVLNSFRSMYRQDIYPGADQSGFLTNVPLDSIGPGMHTLTVEADADDGTINKSTTQVNIIKPAPQIWIDSPRNSSYVKDTISGCGWSVNASAVKEVQVYVDGTKLGDAAINGLRNDVNNIINANGQYKDAVHSGYSYSFQDTALSAGNHVVKVVSVGYDGSSVSASSSIIKPPALSSIDSPSNGQSFGSDVSSINLAGWVLMPDGVATVTAKLDGSVISSFQYGFASDPGIISLAGGQYAGAENARFFAQSIDISKLSGGKHTITLYATGKDNTPYTASVTFEKGTSSYQTALSKAISITTHFEGSGYAAIAGNFDGQGLSLGAMQWCMGQGSLQPLLQRVDNEDNALTRQTFGDNYTSFHDMLNSSFSAQMNWAYSINNSSNQIVEPWRTELYNLCQTAQFQQIQRDAMSPIAGRAMTICNTYGLNTERGFALAYDVANQDGSVSSSAASIIWSKVTLSSPERTKLTAIANAVADTCNPKWSSDVRARKLCIANGSGYVHGEYLNLDTTYGLSDDNFR